MSNNWIYFGLAAALFVVLILTSGCANREANYWGGVSNEVGRIVN